VARVLVALTLLSTFTRVLAGQVDSTRPDSLRADTVLMGVQPRFQTAPLTLRAPGFLNAPWMGAPRLPPALQGEAWDSTVRRVLDSTRTERATAFRYLRLYGRSLQEEEDSLAAEPTERTRGALGLSRKYADLGIDGQVRLEIRSDRLRNERCSPILLLDPNSGCRGGFKPPRLDNQVNLRSSGVIGRRVHLNVDYDTERDFSANNDVQVYYEGLEDEIVRRVEVGTVTFQLPQSRFITAAIPTNNFGVNARFEVGPFGIQTLAATQKGSQLAERVYTVGQTTSQPQDRQVRDLDFETGRFFWVVDPTALPGYPAVDILNLASLTVPPSERPQQVRVYRFRPAVNRNGTDASIGGITALARSLDPNQTYGPVRWELLIQGTDYYLDRSGLWLSLATKLDQNDYLAVSYVTEDGRTVGSFPGQDNPSAADSLRLIVQPKTGPEASTFRYEMRQVYRVAGSDLDRSSLQVNLSVNRSERPLSGAPTYLAQLGLSIPTDPNIFDRENRLFPRTQDPEASQVVRESYVVFPHLRPFADPARLTPAERSDSMYQTPLYLLLQQTSAKFQMRLRYNSSGAGDRSTLSLGALQIRDGSEQLTVRGRRLERGVDYAISYDLGQVTFLNPDALFGSGAAQINARFEEQGLFAVAPTTILGLSTSYNLGERGAINLIGMYQREQSAFKRPALGFEASANLVGGINTELHFKPNAISRVLNRLTSGPATAPSVLDVNAEFAFTKPDPNRSGQAYLEEFESDAGTQVSLRESSWEFGSQPQSGVGVEGLGFGAGFDPSDAVALTWQNLIPSGTGGALEVRPEDIDSLIRISGTSEQRETVMYLTLHADTAGGVVQTNSSSHWSLPRRDFRPRWRSMVTPLSPTGVDLSRNEFLEFWVFQPGSRTTDSAGAQVILDLGTVNEDAVAIAPDSFSISGADTIYTGRQNVGTGRLDTERTSFNIFNAQVDDIGILGDRPDVLTDATSGEQVGDGQVPLCQRILGSAVPVFPWGDLSGRCTRGNGSLDTEDLNGDNVLNASGPNENVFRYIVDLRPGGKYYVRDGRQSPPDASGRVSKWELYRIPIRTPDATIGTPNLRLTQHLRMTIAAPADPGAPDVVARFALARMRLVGSSWVRRAETPITGISGSLGNPTGEVIASVISTENRTDLGYESPPGVFEGLSKRNDLSAGVQINEKSLRLLARDLAVGDRAEAYLRFPAGPQNALSYRELRVWARGRGPGWEERELEAFIKLGSDDRNFYLYHAPAHSNSWEPEFVIDLETWRRLRAQVEQRWLSGEAPSGAAACGSTDQNAYVACEGPYLVHLADPGIRPPNLAAIQEISAGIYHAAGGGPLAEAELWIDDIRLGSPLAETGKAVALDTRLIASDVGTIQASYTRQDGQFRQINTDPTYRTTGNFQINSSWRLDRFLPTSLGLVMPLNVSYVRSDIQPQLLTGTDLRGDALVGLRQPQSWTASYNLSLRRGERGKSWVVRGFLDPLTFAATVTQGRSRTEYSNASSDASNFSLGYNLQMQRRGPKLPFGGIVGSLPKWLRESEGGKSLRAATFSLVPSNVRLSSGLTKDEGDYSSFAVPIVRADDDLVRPSLSLTNVWRNAGGLTWQPLGMLTLTGDLTSTRDLRVYSDSSTLGRLAYGERRFFLGIPVGVERDRTLTTALALTPKITSWLRPRFTTSSNFVLSRTLNTRPAVRTEGDEGGFVLPQTLNNLRSREVGVSVDLARALRQAWGDSSRVGRLLAKVRPLDVRSQLSRTSTFDLAAFDPSLGYMLALGGLDRFLNQEGVGAVGSAETRTTAISSGADLPLGITATFSYGLTTADRFQPVGDRLTQTLTRQREWPVGNVRWTQTFRGGPFTLVAAGLGFRYRQGTSTQPDRVLGGALSATSSSSLTPDVQLSFRNGMGLTFGYATRGQRNESNGSATLLDQEDFTASFTHSFRLPAAFGRSRKQVRSSLSALTSKTSSCLERGGSGDCAIISDVLRREFRGGLDTDLVSTVSAGLQFGYSINDSRHLSQRTSQIFLLASFQLSLFAGDYR
jgi:Motility related/secretion protein